MADYIYEDVFRATGRTIRIKLKAVLLMSECPNVWIQVKDHWDGPEATRYLIKWIKEFCEIHGMKVEQKYDDQGYFLRFVK